MANMDYRRIQYVADRYTQDNRSVYMRGFPHSEDPENIRDYFSERYGKCHYVFNKSSSDRTYWFLALRFDDSSTAREVIDKYDGREVLGHRVQLSVYQDHGKARQMVNDENRHRPTSFRRRRSRSRSRSRDRPSRYRESFRRSSRSCSRSQSPRGRRNRSNSSSPRRRSRSKSNDSRKSNSSTEMKIATPPINNNDGGSDSDDFTKRVTNGDTVKLQNNAKPTNEVPMRFIESMHVIDEFEQKREPVPSAAVPLIRADPPPPPPQAVAPFSGKVTVDLNADYETFDQQLHNVGGGTMSVTDMSAAAAEATAYLAAQKADRKQKRKKRKIGESEQESFAFGVSPVRSSSKELNTSISSTMAVSAPSLRSIETVIAKKLEVTKKFEDQSKTIAAVTKLFISIEPAMSIKLKSKLDILLSKSTPTHLSKFLRALTIKLRKHRKKTPISARERLLNSSKVTDEISPLTEADLANQQQQMTPAAKSSQSNQTRATPIIRRSLSNSSNASNTSKSSSNLKKTTSLIKLTNDQTTVLRHVEAGRSVFFTGAAGTGKSFLLRKIIGLLEPSKTAVTASTGIAASHIGGTTLHAFSGVGASASSGDSLASGVKAAIERISARPLLLRNWRQTQHLIIDEISMVDAEFYSKLDKIGRVLRNRLDKPFGGIQLIICGDFFQLPPVTSRRSSETGPKFAFESKSWNKSINVSIILNDVRRQNESTFIRLLNEVRVGIVSDESKRIFDKLRDIRLTPLVSCGVRKENAASSHAPAMYTRLCTHNDSADAINAARLNELTGETATFDSFDEGDLASINRNCIAASRLQLKIGAQVMLLKNLSVSGGLVNGSIGMVTGFDRELKAPLVRFSRLRNSSPDSPILIGRERFVMKSAGGDSSDAVRCQIPLRLAWAISVHKSQGMSIDALEVSLARVFECGQAYVALSRAISLERLRIIDYEERSIRADDRVIEFYARLKEQSEGRRTIMLDSD